MSRFPSQPNLNMPAFGPQRPTLPSPAEQMRVPMGQPAQPAAPPMLPQGATPAMPQGGGPATPAVPMGGPPAAFGGGNPFQGYQPGTFQGPANANAILQALMAAGMGGGNFPQNVGPMSGQRPANVGPMSGQIGVGRPIGNPPFGQGNRPIGVGRPMGQGY